MKNSMVYKTKELAEDLKIIESTHYLKNLIALRGRNDEPLIFSESLLGLTALLEDAANEGVHTEAEFLPSPDKKDALAIHLLSSDPETDDFIETIAECKENNNDL